MISCSDWIGDCGGKGESLLFADTYFVILILGDDDFALELVFQDVQQLFIRDASRHGHHAYLASEIAFQQYLWFYEEEESESRD